MKRLLQLCTRGVSIVAFALAVPTAFAQSPATPATGSTPPANAGPADARPAFEVATVKINKSGALQTQFDIPPGSGRVSVTNMQLRGLIQSAYRVPANQVLNVPGWVNATRVDIVAKADPSASVQDLQTMLQPLLEERFKLQFHRETRELEVYALVVADKNGRLGPKLTKSDTDCGAVGAAPRNTLAAPAPGERVTCGFVPSGPGHLVTRGLRMASLAQVLSLGTGGRQIVDETGLAGGYDADLTYTPEAFSAAALAARGVSPDAAAAVDPNGPSLFTALPDQLGLKLQQKKIALEVLVIDHIEPPAED